MIAKKSEVIRIEITEAKSLDPIRVYLENYEPGKGRITISCYDRAWVSYWGAMSGKTVQAFFVGCDSGYVLDNLMCGLHGLRAADRKREEAYLTRIVVAVQNALRDLASESPA